MSPIERCTRLGSSMSSIPAYAGTYMRCGAVKKRTEAAKLKQQQQLAALSITPATPDFQPVAPSAGVPDAPNSLSIPKRGRGCPWKQESVAARPSVHAAVIPLRRSSHSTDITTPSSIQHIINSDGAGIDEDDGEGTSDSVEIEDNMDSDDLLPVVRKAKTKPKSTCVSKKSKASRKKAADDIDDNDNDGNAKKVVVNLFNKHAPKASQMGGIAGKNTSGQKSKRLPNSTKSPGPSEPSLGGVPDTNFAMCCKNWETIIELHSCKTHSHPDKKAIFWKDEHGICYPVTESNLNLWANMATQHPDKYYVSKMPPEVNPHQNGPCTRAPAKLQPPASNVPSIGMGMNYYHLYYSSLPPAPFPYPMQAYSMPVPPTSDWLAMQTNAGPQPVDVEAANLDYPLITQNGLATVINTPVEEVRISADMQQFLMVHASTSRNSLGG
ncbi:hypothetical protein F5887DRAFT_924781 [Amanita rubescens]|nr:hypothetical protein F5887DRAFT_924781 [Amanita rubescens]